jgi:hypothetical protein
MQKLIVERFRIMVVDQNKGIAACQIVKGLEYQRVSFPGDDGRDIQLFHRAPPCTVMFTGERIEILAKSYSRQTGIAMTFIIACMRRS